MNLLSEYAFFSNGKKRPKEEGIYPVYGGNGILGYANDYNMENGVIIGRVGAYCGSVYLEKGKCWVSDNAIKAETTERSNLVYLYYLLKGLHLNERQIGTSQPLLTQGILNNIDVSVPEISVQNRIADILESLDEKIHINTEINQNLEEQLSTLFTSRFADSITIASDATCPKLGDLVTIIDNRGKTPPLTTECFEYPIIDVGALKGQGRIIDFKNCSKYVEQNTYENWFRSGHPQPWDTLISTVGSLAEMKLFLGTKGCMAQNVVALRPKLISPLYLYQYLRFIRSDLVAYNIGSVQPSIKVTHIIKHPIFIPDKNSLESFEETAKAITEQIYSNCNETEVLIRLRDTLLPKLMSGEIDVTDINV